MWGRGFSLYFKRDGTKAYSYTNGYNSVERGRNVSQKKKMDDCKSKVLEKERTD